MTSRPVVILALATATTEAVQRLVGFGLDLELQEQQLARDSGEPGLATFQLGDVVPAPVSMPLPAGILSERELQVLQLMSEGNSNPEIGALLGLAANTIKTHVRRIFRRLDVGDRAHAVAVGIRAGLIGDAA